MAAQELAQAQAEAATLREQLAQAHQSAAQEAYRAGQALQAAQLGTWAAAASGVAS